MREVFKAIGLAAATDAAGPDRRRERHGQGAGRRRPAPPLAPRRRPVRPGQLRRPARGPDRERAVRPRARAPSPAPTASRPGRFERAAGGTIFLDEVGELPLSAQAKILRVLQQREFERVGGTETLRTDARVDLGHPPRPARGRSPPAGSARTCTTASTSSGSPSRRSATAPRTSRPWPSTSSAALERRHGWGGLSLSPEALAAIRDRPWPGNVRQLENALARAAIAARGRAILPEHLDADDPADPAVPAAGDPAESLPLRALLAEVERRAIRRALLACGGNRTQTAERLGISRRQLFDKIREYDLQP